MIRIPRIRIRNTHREWHFLWISPNWQQYQGSIVYISTPPPRGVGNMTKRAEGKRKWKFINKICSKTRTNDQKCAYFYTLAKVCKGEKIWSPKGGGGGKEYLSFWMSNIDPCRHGWRLFLNDVVTRKDDACPACTSPLSVYLSILVNL